MIKKQDSYEDFFERSFKEQDVEDAILEEGGQLSFENFKESSKKHLNKKYYEIAFEHPNIKRASGKSIIGEKIFERHFQGKPIYLAKERILKQHPEVRENKSKRLVVASGQTINFGGKIRKGGQFLPKNYFEGAKL